MTATKLPTTHVPATCHRCGNLLGIWIGPRELQMRMRGRQVRIIGGRAIVTCEDCGEQSELHDPLDDITPTP